jgi:translocation and assembly module TamA
MPFALWKGVRPAPSSWRSPARAALLALGMAAGCAGEAAEGRPWIHTVDLQGVRQVSRRDLRKRLALEETSWLPFAPKAYLNSFEVEEDLRRIESYYRSHGYHRARVSDVEVVPRRGGDSVDVKFRVVEGPPIRIAQVRLFGTEDLDKSAKRRIHELDLASGQIFDHERYLAQKESIVGLLKSAGYPWAEVGGEVAVDRDRQVARITLTARPGRWARFGELEVRGTAIVDPRVVAAQVDLATGAPFSLEEVERVRARAYDLGIFSSVSVHYEAIAARPDEVRVVLTVEKETFNQLRLGGGFGFEMLRTEVRAQAIYLRRNFLGGLRTLQLRIAPAYVVIPALWDVHRHGPALVAEAVLTQPRIGFLSQIQWTIGYELGIEYAYQFHGPRTVIGVVRRLWGDRVGLALSYNFQLLQFFESDPAILASPGLAGRLFGYVDPYRLGFLAEEVSLDLRDTRLDTRKGAYLAVAAEEGGIYVGGAFTYEKLRADVRGYLPLGGWVVVAARLEVGHIFVQGDLGSPITRRFALGGASSHRGFNYGRLSRQVPSGLPGVAPIPLGGDESVLGQLEVRVKLARLFGGWLSSALFLDVGDVSAPACVPAPCVGLAGPISDRVDPTRLHYAAGTGLRYQTFIGTIRADLGVRLNRLDPAEPDGLPNPDPGERLAFHLSVGEAF